MNAATYPRPAAANSGDVLSQTRANVKDLLLASEGFRALPPDKQRAIAHNTVELARYLVAPEGIPGTALPSARGYVDPKLGPRATALADPAPGAATGSSDADKQAVADIGKSAFQAQGAMAGAKVAGALLKQVNFPTFVASLIKGVFHAIVEASIEQMEAYGKLVADVAKTLNEFRDENVSDNQGRDHLVDQFPDMFTIGMGDDGNGGQAPRVQLRDGVDESTALSKVNNSLPMPDGGLKSMDLGDADNENKLVQAARTQLATSRQQLLATMVMMGINRIVVTDGKISAKILYDFQARDNRHLQRSAAAYDYAHDASGNLQTTNTGEGTYDSSTEGGERTSSGTDSDQRDASYYSKGTYKYASQPVMTAVSAASETSDAALQTKASLAGVVDVNFKSDYFPLEKMADSFQISQIQNAAKPGQAGRPAGGNAPAGGGSSTATTAQPAAAAKP